MASKPLPHTYLAKGKYWYFRHPTVGNARIEGEAFSAHFMWHYRQLVAQSGADKRVRKARQRIRNIEARAAKRTESHVYFIGAEPDGPIKIGVAKDVASRMVTLQVAMPQTLRLLAAVKGGIAKEREYHRQFEPLKMRGEWFRRGPELLALIATLEAPK